MERLSRSWEVRTGTPEFIITDWKSGHILLYPIPLIDDSIDLVVERLPRKDLRLAQWTSDKPEIHEQWQYKMLNWAAHLAYILDEPNSLDNNKAALHEANFTRDFGLPDNAYAVQRKKQPKRPVVYGGIAQRPMDIAGRRNRSNSY